MSEVESELNDLLDELEDSPRWAVSRRRWVDDPALLKVVLEAKRARVVRDQLAALVEACTEPEDLVRWRAMTFPECNMTGEAAEQRDADRRESAAKYVRHGADRRRAALDRVVQFTDEERVRLAALEERALGEVAAGPPKEREHGWAWDGLRRAE